MNRRLRGNCRFRRTFVFGCALGAAVAAFAPVLAESAEVGPGELKVVILGKIAEFMTWPEGSALDTKDRPFELVVLGETKLAASFDRYFDQQKATIAGHRVFLRYAAHPSEVGRPHLLFVGPGFADRLGEILAAIGDAPTLTAGATAGFADRGLAVNLYVAGGRVRFEISQRALKRQRLRASYRLLGLANLIDDRQARR